VCSSSRKASFHILEAWKDQAGKQQLAPWRSAMNSCCERNGHPTLVSQSPAAESDGPGPR
jgi:hypothetical protein